MEYTLHTASVGRFGNIDLAYALLPASPVVAPWEGPEQQQPAVLMALHPSPAAGGGLTWTLKAPPPQLRNGTGGPRPHPAVLSLVPPLESGCGAAGRVLEKMSS